MLLQRRRKAVPVDRLGEVVRRPERKAHVPVVDDRQHDDGDTGGFRIRFERGENGPAIQAGHHDVERDDGGLKMLRQFEAALAVGGHFHPEAILHERALHQVAHVRVVIDDEDGRLPEPLLAADCAPFAAKALADSGAASLTSRGSVTVKVVPTPGSLATVMSPPIKWQNFRLIARPRPVPPNLRRRGRIRLRECLEDPAHLFRRHANASVADAKVIVLDIPATSAPLSTLECRSRT